MKTCLATFAVLAAAFAPAAALAYPIPPQSLWRQVQRAELIVVGEVVAGEEDPEAMIRVLEVWKGTPPEVLMVERDLNLVCPAPGRFLDGKTILAFLSRDTKVDGLWRVTGLSYGTLYPSDEVRGQYRKLVRDALALQRRGRVSDEEKVAWAVEAASHPGTRWHGLFLLRYGEGDFPAPGRGSLAGRLAPGQRAELARTFAADPTGEDLTLLLPLVEGMRDPALDAAIVRSIDGDLADPDDWYRVAGAFEAVAQRFGVDPPRLEESPGGLDVPTDVWWAGRRDAARRAWLELRPRLRIEGRPVEPR